MHSHSETDKGYLLLADISGFDAYLADVELEHARDVMAELLELLMSSLSPPLRIAGVYQDAILADASRHALARGETLLELTEATYAAFRDRLKSIARNNTCSCRACSAIPTLDLKFLIHFGEYSAAQDENGRLNLGGLDADLVRKRLLKDQVSDGSRSYALFTNASLKQLGLDPDGLTKRSGTYPHLGEISTASLDLGGRYQELTEARRAFITAEEADFVVTHDYATVPPVLWDWLNDPNKRTRWLRWTKWKAGLRPGGRTGVGAVNHCTHGIGSLIETVLEWRPYEYYTVEMRQASMWSSLSATYRLEPLPDGGGTRLHMTGILEEAPARVLARPMFKVFVPWKMKQDFVRLGELIKKEGPAVISPPPAESEGETVS